MQSAAKASCFSILHKFCEDLGAFSVMLANVAKVVGGNAAVDTEIQGVCLLGHWLYTGNAQCYPARYVSFGHSEVVMPRSSA